MESSIARQLRAILCADMVGFSRRMGADEQGTFEAVKALRSQTIDPIVERNRGRIFKNVGDGMLAEFGSAVDAVRCAAEIQCAVASRPADPAGLEPAQFRIGIDLGDVIFDGGDVFGNGVNIAARLQGMADPGSILVSADVFHQVNRRLDVGFEDLGLREAHNIEEPIHVYRVVLDGRPELRGVGPARRWGPALAAIAVAALLIGVLGWQIVPKPGSVSDVAIEPAAALPLPDKPSIAVLAFTNFSSEPEQEYFSDGMSDDITTELSKLSGMFVISRNSSFAYKGRTVDVRAIGRELGVAHVLEGSVRRSGDVFRVNAQLTDARSGAHLWADRYDEPMTEIFSVQDRITRRIVAAMQIKLSPAEDHTLAQFGTDNVDAYDAFLQGWEHYTRRTPIDLANAVSFFSRAIALDKSRGRTFYRAYAALAAAYWVIRIQGWYKETGLGGAFEAETLTRQHLTVALESLIADALAYRVHAQMLYLNDQHAEAVAEAQRAVAANPNDAEGYAMLANTLIFAGRAAEAVGPIEQAMRLDPRYPPAYLAYLGTARFALGQFGEAAALLVRASKRNPENSLMLVHLTAAYGQLGRLSEAAATLAELNRLRRESGTGPYTISTARRLIPYRLAADRDRLIEGLRRAGVPE